MEQSLPPIRHYAIRLFDNLEKAALYIRNFFVAPVVPYVGTYIGIEQDGEYHKYLVKSISYEFPCNDDKEDDVTLIDILVEEENL